MAQQKLNVMALGPGGMTSNASTSRVFASPKPCRVWDVGVTYGANEVVESSGAVYRSIAVGNVGNTPASPSSFWGLEITGSQDGDVCIVVSGVQSSLQMRIGGTWTSISGQPLVIPLVDGQLTVADAFTFSAGNLPYAEITYTVRRGAGHSDKRQGTLTVLNAGAGQIQFSHEFIEIGADVGVTFALSVDGGGVFHVGYISVNQGAAIEMAYALKGWQ